MILKQQQIFQLISIEEMRKKIIQCLRKEAFSCLIFAYITQTFRAPD